jgi:hypothetical protein
VLQHDDGRVEVVPAPAVVRLQGAKPGTVVPSGELGAKPGTLVPGGGPNPVAA